jgi:hypothetical protein
MNRFNSFNPWALILLYLINRCNSNTIGFSGADIHNVCNEAALIAARKDLTGMMSCYCKFLSNFQSQFLCIFSVEILYTFLLLF